MLALVFGISIVKLGMSCRNIQGSSLSWISELGKGRRKMSEKWGGVLPVVIEGFNGEKSDGNPGFIEADYGF